MKTRGPGAGVVELGGAVAGAEVEEGDFVLAFGSVGGSVDERSRWTFGDMRLGKD